MQVRKLSYLAIDRLGELLGLTADALSPIHDLQSAILGLKKAMPSELKEGLDAQLLAEGLLTLTLYSPQDINFTTWNRPKISDFSFSYENQ